MKKNKLIASVAVFKELHDSNKDIYDIISEFVKSAIQTNKKWNATATEITRLLEQEFEFKLPEAVIKTALKKRLIKSGYLTLENGEYIVKDFHSLVSDDFNKTFNAKKDLYKKTEDEFIEFIQSTRDDDLTEKNIADIRDSITHYLLGNGISETYTNEISAYIIKNQYNREFKERLDDIKEGIVLYTGVRYTADLNELGKWNNEMTIYLDTEIIFYFAGYNGEIYKDIFQDFYRLAKEINQSSNSKKIHLKYFVETEKEIINFFHAASLIVEGKMTLDPSKTAMKEIVNGCSAKSDVLFKRNKLFDDLKRVGILIEENTDYYKENTYVVEGNAVIEELKKVSEEKNREFDEEKCSGYLKLFTKINSLRRGINNLGFDRSKYIILTGNKFVHYLAHSEHIKTKERNIPFATDLDYITDKFWFKLKKGFGKSDDKPKSFDFITKAQIVLSAQVNNTVQGKFNELNTLYDNGQLTKEQAISLTYMLRESSLKPEEITEENLQQNLTFINEFSIEEYKRERERLKQKVIEGEKAKNELKKRDRLERNAQTKTLKNICKLKTALILPFIVVLNLLVFLGGYYVVQVFLKTNDSTIAIISLVVGVLALFPLYKLSKTFYYFLVFKSKNIYTEKVRKIVFPN